MKYIKVKKMNKDSLKAYSELINELWESVGKKK